MLRLKGELAKSLNTADEEIFGDDFNEEEAGTTAEGEEEILDEDAMSKKSPSTK